MRSMFGPCPLQPNMLTDMRLKIPSGAPQEANVAFKKPYCKINQDITGGGYHSKFRPPSPKLKTTLQSARKKGNQENPNRGACLKACLGLHPYSQTCLQTCASRSIQDFQDKPERQVSQDKLCSLTGKWKNPRNLNR